MHKNQDTRIKCNKNYNKSVKEKEKKRNKRKIKCVEFAIQNIHVKSKDIQTKAITTSNDNDKVHRI